MSPGVRAAAHLFAAAITATVALVALLTGTCTSAVATLAVAGLVQAVIGADTAHQLRRALRVRHRIGLRDH